MTVENNPPRSPQDPTSGSSSDPASGPDNSVARREKTLPDGTLYERPSQRMFRRSRRAEERRRKQARDDANFFKAVFSLAGVATGFVFILIYLAQSGGGGGLIAMAPLAQPWLGPFSKLEIFGGLFIAVLAALYLWRIRKR